MESISVFAAELFAEIDAKVEETDVWMLAYPYFPALPDMWSGRRIPKYKVVRLRWRCPECQARYGRKQPDCPCCLKRGPARERAARGDDGSIFGIPRGDDDGASIVA